MLLKATHVPVVGAIWLYEQLAIAHRRDSTSAPLSGPQMPVPSKRPPRLPVNSPRLLMADAQAGPGRSTHHAHRPHNRTGLADSDAQLKNLVLRLSAQVEELTTVVSQLSEQREVKTTAA